MRTICIWKCPVAREVKKPGYSSHHDSKVNHSLLFSESGSRGRGGEFGRFRIDFIMYHLVFRNDSFIFFCRNNYKEDVSKLLGMLISSRSSRSSFR